MWCPDPVPPRRGQGRGRRGKASEDAATRSPGTAPRFPPAARPPAPPAPPHQEPSAQTDRQTDGAERGGGGGRRGRAQPRGVAHKGGPRGRGPLTSSASKVTKLVMANPSMMSSSAEVDSRRFLRGGRGRDGAEDGGFPLSSLSEPDDEASEGARVRPAPPPPAAPAPSPPRERLSRSRCDRDRRFLRSPWPRAGPSMAPPRRGAPRSPPARHRLRPRPHRKTDTDPSLPRLGVPPPRAGRGGDGGRKTAERGRKRGEREGGRGGEREGARGRGRAASSPSAGLPAAARVGDARPPPSKVMAERAGLLRRRKNNSRAGDKSG